MATNSVSHRHHRRDDDDANQIDHQKVVVVMVPLPAQGHLNQHLQLSRRITAYNIHVHYATTTADTRQARRRVHGWEPLTAANIHFDDLHKLEFECPNPNSNAANNFPYHLQPMFDAVALLRSLSSAADRVVLIHDSMMSSIVQDVASIPCWIF